MLIRELLLVSLATALTSVSAAGSPTRRYVDRAFIFQFEEGQESAGFLQGLEQYGQVRFTYNSTLFSGVSVKLHDLGNASATALRLAEHPAVKRHAQVGIRGRPNSKSVDQGYAPDNSGYDPGSQQQGVDPDQKQQPYSHDKRRRRHALDARGLDGSSTTTTSGGKPLPDAFSPHVMAQVDLLRAKNITGRGVKVAVVDTGVDYTHPALGGGFGPGHLVEFGTDLVGDDYDGTNDPVPDSDPMDCVGHGTHVCGIIAAQENPLNFTGVAPDVTLGMYRVFGCYGEAGDDVVIAAFLQAYHDGADVISSSIGELLGWPEEMLTALVSSINAAGVPCIVSAGNDGDLGLFASSGASDGLGTTAVASVDNLLTPVVRFIGSNYTIGGGKPVPFEYSLAKPAHWTGVSLSVFSTSQVLSGPGEDDACDPLPDSTPDLSDFIVLIKAGSCSPVERAQNAAAKGARFVMFHDQGMNTVIRDMGQVPQIVASGSVDPQLANSWIEALESGKTVELTMADPFGSLPVVRESKNTLTGGFMSNFSSWGPSWEMDFKPQFAAPGGFILSTFPVSVGSYVVVSGTSMSTPFVAGVYALMIQARGTRDPAVLQSLLSSTAKPLEYNVNGARGSFLAPTAQQGGGLVQAFDAAYTTTLVNVSSLAFNDSEHRADSIAFMVRNTGENSIRYEVSDLPTNSFYTLSTSDPLNPAPLPNPDVPSHADLDFSQTEFTLGGGQSVVIEVSACDPADIDPGRLAVWSGFVAIRGSDGCSLTVPYMGVAGSIREHALFAPSGSAFISSTSDPDTDPIAAGSGAFTLPGPGNSKPNSVLPVAALDLALGTRVFEAHVIAQDAATISAAARLGLALIANGTSGSAQGTRDIGQLFASPSLTNPRGLNTQSWDGQLQDLNYAPPGNYTILFRALSIFGDASEEGDWQETETAPFSIVYE